jgi:two-component system, OmpR family, phosphate regulon sensor histidine kinase PhoR
MQITWQAWWFAIGRLALVLLIGLLLGLVLGRVWLGLFAALAIYVAWQLVNLFRLEWWVRHRSYADPPDLEGIWGQVVAQVVRLHRRKRFHKQRFLQLLRQIQRSTAALPDGVAILNAQREITWLNRTAAELLRLRGREDLGVAVHAITHQSSGLADCALWRRAVAVAATGCFKANAAGIHAQGFCRQCFA